jgi:hypothetical protein
VVIWWPEEDTGDHGQVPESYLVLDGDCYAFDKEGNFVDDRIHRQPNAEIRRKGLLSLILFDIKWDDKRLHYEHGDSPRKPLRFDLTLANVPEVVRTMNQEGYFL